MELYDNTDRLDDLIDQIDQTNVNKKKKGVLLFLGVITVIAFTTYLSFAQGDEPHSNDKITNKTDSNINISTKAKAQTISSSIQLENFKAASGQETSMENDVTADDIINSKTAAIFLDGKKNATQYLKDNILYPKDAFNNEIEGKVLVQVTINEEGTVVSPKIVEGLGYGCDEEVIRIVSEMPNWQPARINGNPVKKSYILTVTFSLS